MATLQQNPNYTSHERLDEVTAPSTPTCFRCHGLLIRTFCVSPGEGISDFQIEVMKCLQCGNLFDATILENRWRSEHHQLIPHKGGRKP